MYHQWSPYAGARPSTSSHASCWMSVTPENAIVGTAADTARTSRGCWAMWFISAGAPERADVLDPAADDVDQAALALVAALARRPRGPPRATPATSASAPGLVAEHRQRGVGEREVGVERRGLAEQLLAAGLQPHHALETGVVGAPRPRPWSTAAGPSGSRGRATGWCPPTSRPSASRRGSGATASSTAVATRERLASGSRGRRSTPTARRGAARRGSRAARRSSRAESTSRPSYGAHAHPGGREPREGARRRAAGAGRRGAGRRAARTSRCGPVQLTTQPTSRVVPSASVTRRPPRGSGSASATSAAAPTSSRPARASSREHDARSRAPSGAARRSSAPASSREELARGRSSLEPLPERRDLEAQPVDRRTPVAGGAR